MVMKTGALTAPANTRDRVANRLGEDVVKESAFSADVLDQILKNADKDPGLRKALDIRQQGKTRRAVYDQTKEFQDALAAKDQELDLLRLQMQDIQNGNGNDYHGNEVDGSGNGAEPAAPSPELDLESDVGGAEDGVEPATAPRDVSALRPARRRKR